MAPGSPLLRLKADTISHGGGMDLDQLDNLLRVATDLSFKLATGLAQLPPPDQMYQFIQDMMHQAWDSVPAINDAFAHARR